MGDKLNYQRLKDSGWKVSVIWECELKKDVRIYTLECVEKTIREQTD